MTGVVWLSYGVVVAFIVLVLIMLYVSIDTKNYQKRQQQIKRDVQEHTAACYRYFIISLQNTPPSRNVVSREGMNANPMILPVLIC